MPLFWLEIGRVRVMMVIGLWFSCGIGIILVCTSYWKLVGSSRHFIIYPTGLAEPNALSFAIHVLLVDRQQQAAAL